ncbi:hypothetical protein NIES4101_51410 [Calothrix sp. NIES-4101]|uniref:coiled coil domain-containing protein n=1 Tax=Calothrix sp. UHCC 0171 TaxID=3110245 RepID=UPI000B5EDA0B|nr:coiled coil domain-containing protein [Calothrix sp. UHCC 0171]MEA5571754.1 hypothetical protein [Calothrix sp. UHCC 0171]BAZ39189.1 hypothetical protein NIES4101_51410 [Calothrix sp. NIES-4101]
MNTKQDFQEKMEIQLAKLQTQIDELKVKSSLAQADAKDAYQEQLASLNTKCQTTRLKLQELKSKGGNAWEEMKDGLETAWSDLQDSFNRAVTHFR